MPYIEPRDRKTLDAGGRMRNAGELNYKITQTILQYLKHHDLSYRTCNDIVGALENAKHEFQRRIQDPYEDLKIQQNGDVYQDVLP